MKKKKFIQRLLTIALFFCLSGCVSILVFESPVQTVGKRIADIHKVRFGMTETEVMSILGSEVIIGFEKSENMDEALVPITIKQPFRSEIISNKKILYYFTFINRADGTVSEDELTPLIFKNDRLIGKGEDDLFEIKNQ